MFRIFRVAGDSMSPALTDGDFVISMKLPKLGLPVGAVVVVRDAVRGLLVKRLAGWHDDGIDVRGDNAAASTDSRQLGALPASAICGRVIASVRAPRTSSAER